MLMLDVQNLVIQQHCLKRPLMNRSKIDFQDRLLLNAGQKYCRMLQESILQNFRPTLSYHMSLKPLFCLFWSGLLRQVLSLEIAVALLMRLYVCQCSHLGVIIQEMTNNNIQLLLVYK